MEVKIIAEDGSISNKEVEMLNAEAMKFEVDDTSPEGRSVASAIGYRRVRVYKTARDGVICTVQKGRASLPQTYLVNDYLPEDIKRALNADEEIYNLKMQNKSAHNTTAKALTKKIRVLAQMETTETKCPT